MPCPDPSYDAPAAAPAGTVWVCLPTYNEAENLRPMVAALLNVFDAHSIDGHVLVIDDSSPDGTGLIADELRRSDPRVTVLHRDERSGLGPAYRDGFREAVAHGASLIMEMDCDFSHDPNAIPAMLEASRGADLVLGSRYVEGGAVTDWGPLRRLISRGGCAYARLALGGGPKDMTGGFKCFRREVLETIQLDDVQAAGYVFQVEMTYRVLLAGFSVVEVPITFKDRAVGVSKMSGRIVLEAAVLVPLLRWRLRGQARSKPNTRRVG